LSFQKSALNNNCFFEAPPEHNLNSARDALLNADLISANKNPAALAEPSGVQIFEATDVGLKSAALPFDSVVAAAFLWGLEKGFDIKLLAKVFAQISESQLALRPRVEKQIIEQFENRTQAATDSPLPEELYIRALPQNVAVFRKDSKQKAQMVGGRGLIVKAPLSVAQNSSLFVALNPFETTFDKHLVAAVEEIIPLPDADILKKVFPKSFSNPVVWQWVPDNRSLKPILETRYLDLVVESTRQFPKSYMNSDFWASGVETFLIQVGKEWNYFCSVFQSKTENLPEKLWFLFANCPQEFESHKLEKLFDPQVFIDLARDFLLTIPDPAHEVLSFEGFLFSEFVNEFLNYNQLELIHKMAPSKIKSPQGQFLPISYPPIGDTNSNARMSGKIQAFFGLRETPTIGWGKVKVTVELLTPGQKPIQTTQDLKSFWSKTYFEIKNPLRARYPKHKWPDDPNQF
jgi:HrpA-like RNA helicase